ncbi:MAG TPA: DUF4321 domain-containing protein [Clostridiaceae bacterium]
MSGVNKRSGFFVFVLFLAAIGGTLIGEILGSNVKFLSFLKAVYTIGTGKPFIVDLKVITLTLGFNFSLNIMTILALFLAIILFRKY